MQKNKKQKTKKGEFCWTEKYVKIEEYVNIYNQTCDKLFFKMLRSTLKD